MKLSRARYFGPLRLIVDSINGTDLCVDHVSLESWMREKILNKKNQN